MSSRHDGTFDINCGKSPSLVTEQGWNIEGTGNGFPPPALEDTPAALRIEVLGEEGPATVVTDNQAAIEARFKLAPYAGAQPNGCSTIDPAGVGLLLVIVMRMRTKRRTRTDRSI